jgi:acetyl-CoA synthetase
MRDYDAAYRNFSLDALERQVLHGRLDRGLNACVECCDRWASDERVALEWIGRDGSRETLTFAFLQQSATRFASMLAARGVGRGDVVAGLLPRIPELLTVVLGTWRAQFTSRCSRPSVPRQSSSVSLRQAAAKRS